MSETTLMLRPAVAEDVDFITALERLPENGAFVSANTDAEHGHWLTDADYQYFIFDQDGRDVGFVILCGLAGPHCNIEIRRIIVAEPGAGLGRQGLALAMDWAFDEGGAHRLWLDVLVHNLRAQRAYRALGFREEGRWRQSWLHDGQYHDQILMGILAEEYRQGRAEPGFDIIGLDHIVIRTKDKPRLEAFYTGVLGCTIERRLDHIGLVQLRAGHSLIDIIDDSHDFRRTIVQDGQTPPNMDHFCLRISPFDAEGLSAYLREKGVEPDKPGKRYGATGNGISIYLHDPDGNGLELKSPDTLD